MRSGKTLKIAKIAATPRARIPDWTPPTNSAAVIGLAESAASTSVAGADRHGRFGDDHGKTPQPAAAISRAAGVDRSSGRRGPSPPPAMGVPTAMNTASASGGRNRKDRSRNRAGRLWYWPRPARSRPGSKIGIFATAQVCDSCRHPLSTAGDLMAEIGEAGAGHQPHITRANHGNSHATAVDDG